jgi:multiple sugar transport system permease protein
MSAQERRNLRNGLLFVLPWILGFLAFTIVPLVSSLYYSFTSYDVLRPPHWVGFYNYVRLFTTDPYIPGAVANTLYLAALGIPLGTLSALGLALLLNQRLQGIAFYRTLYYLPTMMPVVVTAFIWLLALDPQQGIVNNVLGLVGIEGPGWLNSPDWSKPGLIILGLWGVGNSMVIYLAGLQDVPQHLIDAAAIDGAGWWQRLRAITLPMISPVIFFNVVLGVIGAFQNFTIVFIMTGGGPAQSTLTWGLLIYQNAFVWSRMGYASAMAWAMFVVVLLITLLLFRIGSSVVYYEGDDGRR